MRRGAAWPAKRPSSRLVVREHKHRCTSQRAVARRGGQGDPDARCAVVTVSAFVSGIRCPVSGVHPSGLGVRLSGRPAVRCPATWDRRPESGARPSAVQPSGAQPSGVCPIRPDASVSSHSGGSVGDQVEVAGRP